MASTMVSKWCSFSSIHSTSIDLPCQVVICRVNSQETAAVRVTTALVATFAQPQRHDAGGETSPHSLSVFSTFSLMVKRLPCLHLSSLLFRRPEPNRRSPKVPERSGRCVSIEAESHFAGDEEVEEGRAEVGGAARSDVGHATLTALLFRHPRFN